MLFRYPSVSLETTGKSLFVYVDDISQQELDQIVSLFCSKFDILIGEQTSQITLTEIMNLKLPFVYETPIKSKI